MNLHKEYPRKSLLFHYNLIFSEFLDGLFQVNFKKEDRDKTAFIYEKKCYAV